MNETKQAIPRLEVTRGENMGQSYQVTGPIRIGRERDNDIILLDTKVSRYHARISLTGDQWTVTDLGSSNRTYVNDKPITKPTPLREGDRISLGETELTLRLPRPTGETAPAKPVTAPPPSQPRPRQTPRLAWLAGGFILLLCVAALFIVYLLTGRILRSEETPVVADASPVAADSTAEKPSLSDPAPSLSVAYEEDFSDSSSGWDDAFDTHSMKQYGNGRYQIEVTNSNLVAWGLANRDVADFEIAVEARLESEAEDNSYGLLFRFLDRKNFYRFDISGDGFFLVSKFIEGEWVTLIDDWTPSPAINTGLGADNLLKVRAFGPEITVWVNDQELASITDDALSHGNFGFFASSFSDPYMWVSFDNLKLWAPEEETLTMIPTVSRRPPSPTAVPIFTATATPSPTPSPTMTPLPTAVITESAATPTLSPTPTETPPPTPTPEPTATPEPLPAYVSRDQILARGESRVEGRIVFPLYDTERNTYDIYIADAADGDNRALVQANASQPGLSVDGEDLAYRSWQPDRRGLYARPLSGGDAWQVDPYFESARPQFSPVDKNLMYHSRVGGKEPAIYRLVDGIGQVMRRDGYPIQGEAAKWGPDGQQFVYSSCLGSKCGVIMSNLDGTNPFMLADHPTDTNPEVSPDGSSVIFMSNRAGNWEIYRVGAEGGEIVALTSDPATDGLPTWSPNGSKIAFVSNRDGEWSVWDMNPDGTNKRRLFTLEGTIDGIVQHDIANSRGWLEENIDWIP